MKSLAVILFNILKWILILVLILFSIATFIGKSYLQTFILWLAAAVMIYWPEILKRNLKGHISVLVRAGTALVLLVAGFLLFRPEPKRSIYMSEAQPVPMTSEQKSRMELPVLLFLGTKDPIVGDATEAESTAGEFPNIRIEVLESGHLVSVEQAAYMNKVICEFLDL